jgi:hypothetical protein
MVLDKNFLFNGKSIRQGKGRGKEKSRAKGKGESASSSPFMQESKDLLLTVGCMIYSGLKIPIQLIQQPPDYRS